MTTTTVVTVVPPLFDEARLAVAGARYSGPIRVSYACDIRQWFTWCHQNHLPPFAVRRGHLELWARDMKHMDEPRPPWRDACRRWPGSTGSR